jgi:GT2 family glycosyltransferase
VIIENNKLGGLRQRIQRIIARFFLLNNFDGKMTISGFGYPIYEGHLVRLMEVEMLNGCNMSFRKECLKNYRFDDWFKGYSFREDVDLSYRISQDYNLVMLPDANLYHMYGSSNRLNINDKKKMEFSNYYFIFKKFKYKNFFSYVLFFYSLIGIFIMDLIDFAWSFKIYKLKLFFADFTGLLNLLLLISKSKI